MLVTKTPPLVAYGLPLRKELVGRPNGYTSGHPASTSPRLIQIRPLKPALRPPSKDNATTVLLTGNRVPHVALKQKNTMPFWLEPPKVSGYLSLLFIFSAPYLH